MKKLPLAVFSALLALFILQCQPDVITQSPVEDRLPEGETIAVDSNITSDVIWTSGNTYILNDLIAVTANATLTIEPCVVVKAARGATGLIIDRGARIDARGTSTCPVIFTSTEDLLEPGEIVSPNLTGDDRGLWGGLFVLGQAPVSSMVSPNIVSFLPPSLPLIFGGDSPADNSGTLRFVSIRHTGFETAPDERPSGLNLAGVGSGTTIDQVELFANSDDGFRVLGGAVQVRNVVTSHFQDDGYDCDMGYAGTMDNLIGIGGSSSNSSLELDGGEGAVNPSFTIRNASFRGSQSGENYLDFQHNVHCLIENAYFFSFDADAVVKLDRDEDAGNWLAGRIDVGNLAFNTSHLNSGNTTIEAIFVDAGADGEDAFSVRPPDAAIVSVPATGADKSAFADWTVAGVTGALDGF